MSKFIRIISLLSVLLFSAGCIYLCFLASRPLIAQGVYIDEHALSYGKVAKSLTNTESLQNTHQLISSCYKQVPNIVSLSPHEQQLAFSHCLRDAVHLLGFQFSLDRKNAVVTITHNPQRATVSESLLVLATFQPFEFGTQISSFSVVLTGLLAGIEKGYLARQISIIAPLPTTLITFVPDSFTSLTESLRSPEALFHLMLSSSNQTTTANLAPVNRFFLLYRQEMFASVSKHFTSHLAAGTPNALPSMPLATLAVELQPFGCSGDVTLQSVYSRGNQANLDLASGFIHALESVARNLKIHTHAPVFPVLDQTSGTIFPAQMWYPSPRSMNDVVHNIHSSTRRQLSLAQRIVKHQQNFPALFSLLQSQQRVAAQQVSSRRSSLSTYYPAQPLPLPLSSTATTGSTTTTTTTADPSLSFFFRCIYALEPLWIEAWTAISSYIPHMPNRRVQYPLSSSLTREGQGIWRYMMAQATASPHRYLHSGFEPLHVDTMTISTMIDQSVDEYERVLFSAVSHFYQALDTHKTDEIAVGDEEHNSNNQEYTAEHVLVGPFMGFDALTTPTISVDRRHHPFPPSSRDHHQQQQQQHHHIDNNAITNHHIVPITSLQATTPHWTSPITQKHYPGGLATVRLLDLFQESNHLMFSNEPDPREIAKYASTRLAPPVSTPDLPTVRTTTATLLNCPKLENVRELTAGIELWLQMFNSAHETLHHTTWLYLLSSVEDFSTMEKFIPAFLLIWVSIPLVVLISSFMNPSTDHISSSGTTLNSTSSTPPSPPPLPHSATTAVNDTVTEAAIQPVASQSSPSSPSIASMNPPSGDSAAAYHAPRLTTQSSKSIVNSSPPSPQTTLSLPVISSTSPSFTLFSNVICGLLLSLASLFLSVFPYIARMVSFLLFCLFFSIAKLYLPTADFETIVRVLFSRQVAAGASAALVSLDSLSIPQQLLLYIAGHHHSIYTNPESTSILSVLPPFSFCILFVMIYSFFFTLWYTITIKKMFRTPSWLAIISVSLPLCAALNFSFSIVLAIPVVLLVFTMAFSGLFSQFPTHSPSKLPSTNKPRRCSPVSLSRILSKAVIVPILVFTSPLMLNYIRYNLLFSQSLDSSPPVCLSTLQNGSLMPLQSSLCWAYVWLGYDPTRIFITPSLDTTSTQLLSALSPDKLAESAPPFPLLVDVAAALAQPAVDGLDFDVGLKLGFARALTQATHIQLDFNGLNAGLFSTQKEGNHLVLLMTDIIHYILQGLNSMCSQAIYQLLHIQWVAFWTIYAPVYFVAWILFLFIW